MCFTYYNITLILLRYLCVCVCARLLSSSSLSLQFIARLRFSAHDCSFCIQKHCVCAPRWRQHGNSDGALTAAASQWQRQSERERERESARHECGAELVSSRGRKRRAALWLGVRWSVSSISCSQLARSKSSNRRDISALRWASWLHELISKSTQLLSNSTKAKTQSRAQFDPARSLLACADADAVALLLLLPIAAKTPTRTHTESAHEKHTHSHSI